MAEQIGNEGARQAAQEVEAAVVESENAGEALASTKAGSSYRFICIIAWRQSADRMALKTIACTTTKWSWRPGLHGNGIGYGRG